MLALRKQGYTSSGSLLFFHITAHLVLLASGSHIIPLSRHSNQSVTPPSQISEDVWYNDCAAIVFGLPIDDFDRRYPKEDQDFLFWEPWPDQIWTEEKYRLPKVFNNKNCRVVIRGNSENEERGGFSTWEVIKEELTDLIDEVEENQMMDGAEYTLGNTVSGEEEIGIRLLLQPDYGVRRTNGTSVIEIKRHGFGRP